MFNAPAMEQRLKADEKLNNNGKKIKHHSNNKSDKRRRAENEELMAKLQEMEGVIDAIIFDAFGCNADYGNDVQKVADIFAELIHGVYFNCFKSVNFAIPECGGYGMGYGNSSGNKKNEELMKYKFRIFQEAFEQRKMS